MCFSKFNKGPISGHTRLIDTSESLLLDEKFDTWLDLRPLMCIQSSARKSDDWSQASMKSWNLKLTPDCCCELRAAGVSPHDISNAVVTPTIVSKLLNYVLIHPLPHSHKNPQELTKSIKLALDAARLTTSIQINHLTSHIGQRALDALDFNTSNIIDKLSHLPPEVHNLIRVCEDMDNVVYKFRLLRNHLKVSSRYKRAQERIQAIGRFTRLPSINSEIVITRELLLLTFQDTHYLLNSDLLLEIYNKLHETMNVLIFNYLQAGTVLPQNHYMLVSSFIKHLSARVAKFHPHATQTLEQLKRSNSGFKYLKTIEGLGVSEIIARNDMMEQWDNRLLQTTLWESVYDDGLDPSRTYSESVLNSIWSQATTPQIADMLGLIKLCGHPSIDVEEGLRKLHERTHQQLNINPNTVQQSLGVLIRDVTRSYYRKYKRYPAFQPFRNQVHPNLIRLINQQIDPSSPVGVRLWRGITSMDWSRLTFGQNDEFDPVHNQLPLLKDKALGLTRSKVLRMVILPGVDDSTFTHVNSKLNQEDNLEDEHIGTSHAKAPVNQLGPIVERRALLKFLLTPHFTNSFNQYLEHYINEPEWTNAVLDYLVIKLTPKELEEKPEGRMFGASPAEERNRRIVQEFNVMSFMDEYIPDQLMTPNELLMLKKLFSFRHFGKLYPNHVTLQVSFDFSKWNNNMRSESIDVPAHLLLDRWFNTDIYSKTMKAYQNMMVYHSDAIGQCFWLGQDGGIEGLNQATWSLIFLGGIKQALERIGVIYQVTVKGDDVRAALILPQNVIDANGLDTVRDRILTQLQDLCNDMGWQLNPHECFVSLTTICTSKQYQVRDTWLPAASKKIMKAESLANLIFPTLEDIISNVFSTCHSACSQATAVLPAYITASLAAARILINELAPNQRTLDSVSSLLLWPQILSGPGCLPLQTFFIRGENDMLSLSISLFRYILDTHELSRLHRPILSILAYEPTINPDLSLLLGDPYSIPIKAPIRPSTILKRNVKDQLRKIVKNVELRKILSLSSLELEKDFKNTLMSMRPYYAKLATVLWENSPFFLQEEIIAKFMQSSTVIAFLSLSRDMKFHISNAHNVLKDMVEAAKKRFAFWIRTIYYPNAGGDFLLGVARHLFLNNAICSTAITQMARDNCWGFEIKGITYPSLVDQNMLITPEDLNDIFPDTLIDGFYSQILINQHSLVMQTDVVSHHYASLPNNIPWLGSTTSSKNGNTPFDMDITSPSLSKLKRLINIYRSGHYFGDGFRKLVRSLISAYTRVPTDTILALAPESGGGHLAHRVQINSFSMTTMPNMRPNIFQLSRLNDESLRGIQSDPNDRTINFAARHFYLKIMASFRLQSNQLLADTQPKTLLSIFHGRTNEDGHFELCPACCAVVEDEFVRFSEPTFMDLTMYTSITFIGISSKEEEGLRRGLVSAVVGRARRLLEADEIDRTNELYLEVASRQIINKLGKQFSQIFQESQAHGFAKLPSGALLDVISTSLGYKSIGLSPISLNVVRAMKAVDLYNSILTEVIHWAIEWFLDLDKPSELESVRTLLPHLNPLSGLFDHMISAGVMRKILSGCRQAYYLPTPLTWSHAAMSDGNAAAISFTTHHQHLLESMIYRGEFPAKVRIFVQMESNDVIIAKLHQEYDRFIKYCVKLSLSRIDNASVLRHIDGMVCADRCLLDLSDGDLTRFDVDVMVPRTFDQRLEHCRQLTQVQIGPDAQHTTWLHCVARLVLCFNMQYYFAVADWDELLADLNDRPGFRYELARPSGYQQYEIPPRDQQLEEDNIGFGYIVTIWGLNKARWVYDTIHILFPEYLEMGFIDVYLENDWDMISTTVLWYNTRYLSAMTTEDAERILRSHQIDLDGDGYLLMGEDEGDNDEHDVIVVEEEDIARSCNWNINYHLANRQQAPPDLVPLANYPLSPHIHMQTILEPLIVHDNLQSYHISKAECYRIFRGMNAGSSRMIMVMQRCGILRLIQESNQPNLVLAVGDGGGGITNYILSLSTSVKSVFCSLMLDVSTGRQVMGAPVSNPPVELVNEPDRRDKISRCYYSNLYPGDITDNSVREGIRNYIKMIDGDFILAFSDMDRPSSIPDSEYLNMIISFITTCYIREPRPMLIICKIQLNLYPPFLNLMYLLYARHLHHHIVRTPACREFSHDAYLVISHPINVANLVNEMEKVASQDYTVENHIVIMDSVTNDMQHICYTGLRYRIFIDSPQSNLFNQLDQLNYPPLLLRTTRQMYFRLGLTMVHKPGCYCTIINEVINTINSNYHRTMRECAKIGKNFHRKWGTYAGQGHKRTVTSSTTVFTIGNLNRLIILSTVGYMLGAWEDSDVTNIQDLFQLSAGVIIRNIIDDLRSLAWECQIFSWRGIVIIKWRNLSINLNIRVMKAMRLSLQFLSWYYAQGHIANISPEVDLTTRMHELGIDQWRDCCSQYARGHARNQLDRLQHIRPNTIHVTDQFDAYVGYPRCDQILQYIGRAGEPPVEDIAREMMPLMDLPIPMDHLSRVLSGGEVTDPFPIMELLPHGLEGELDELVDDMDDN